MSVGDTGNIVSCKVKDLSVEKLATPTATGNRLSPSSKSYGNSNFV